jgi:hypothetical protein
VAFTKAEPGTPLYEYFISQDAQPACARTDQLVAGLARTGIKAGVAGSLSVQQASHEEGWSHVPPKVVSSLQAKTGPWPK